VITAERVAHAVSEIARLNRDDQPEKPQIEADPAHRHPRLLRNIPRPWPPNPVTAEA
jgi:hypothetical protein